MQFIVLALAAVHAHPTRLSSRSLIITVAQGTEMLTFHIWIDCQVIDTDKGCVGAWHAGWKYEMGSWFQIPILNDRCSLPSMKKGTLLEREACG